MRNFVFLVEVLRGKKTHFYEICNTEMVTVEKKIYQMRFLRSGE